ncbi:MAG: MATE family efflux transporter [Lachnospiraceae bacterium]|nr:MATE family efflux transporter [Lachnospiraceae bacterium]
MNSNTTNLGSGNIRNLLFKLAIPAVVAQIINLLYNIVDRIYIGHIPVEGTNALTGVGLCLPIIMLVNAFASLAGAGGAPRAAIAMGQGKKEDAENILGNCFATLLIIAVILTVGLSAAAEPLLWLFGASENTIPYALDYLRIYLLGNVFVLIVMGMNPFLTTQGFAKFSMLTTVIGAIINIVLDPIFIFGFHMGVRGAALATIMSQCVSAVWVLRFLTGKKTILKLRIKNLKIHASVILPCLALGVSTFIMLSTESLLNISFNSSLSKYGGDIAVGSMTIISSVSQLITLPMNGVCQGAQPIISYNFGAGNKERVMSAFRYVLLLCGGYATLGCLLTLLMPEVFAGIFSSDSILIENAAWCMRVYMAGIFAFGFQCACQQTFVALGQAKISLLLACLRKLILLIPLIFILPHFFENKVFAVFLAEPISDITAGLITTICFFASIKGILEKNPKNC